MFVFLLALASAAVAAPAFAATGDGRVVYGENGTGVLRSRTRTNASGAWSAEGNGSTTATTVAFTITQASPQADEFITASKNNTTLYVSRYNGAWNLDITEAGISDTSTLRNFDLAYEKNTGNALVAYGNGGTSDEISYYYYVATTSSWIGPCTLELSGIAAAVEWVRLASRPDSDELTMAVSDSGNNVTAIVWSPPTISDPYAGDPNPANCTTIGSYWTDDAGDLTGAQNAPTSNYYKMDVAYEQTSGDVLVAWYRSTGTTLDYATNPGSGTGWTTSTYADVTNNASQIDLCADPGSDQIGMASLTASGTSADTEMAIWDGTSAWGNLSSDLDATAESNTSNRSIACGWVGTSGKMVAVFNDEQTTGDLDWFSWTSGGGWATGADQSYSASTEQERDIRVYNYPGENKIAVLFATGATSSFSDLWAMRYDGTNWTVEDGDTGTGGNQALETALSAQTAGASGLALTAFSPTPVAEILNVATQKLGDATKVVWNTNSESRVAKFHVARAERLLASGEPLAFTRVTDLGVPAAGGPTSGHDYAWFDMKAEADKDYEYKVEVIGKGGDEVTQTVGPVAVDPGGRVTHLNPVSGISTTSSFDQPMAAAPRLSRTGEVVQLTETKEGDLASRALKRERKAEAAAVATPRPAAAAAKALKKSPMVKLKVTEPGLYRVTGQELAEAGVDLATLKPKALGLTAQGQPVPLRLLGMEDGTVDAADALEFYGAPDVTRHYKMQVYWLDFEADNPARMATRSNGGARGFAVLSYPHTLHLEGNEAYYSESPTDAHWFFDYEIYAGDSYDITLDVDQLAHTGEDAKLVVGLQGLSTWGYGDSAHKRQHAILRLNGEQVGAHEWEGDTYARLVLTVPVAQLQEGANTLTVEATDEDGTLEQFFMVDAVRLTYPRKLVADAEGLAFRTAARPQALYAIEGFPSAEALAYELHSDGTVTHITDPLVEVEGDAYRVVLADGTLRGASLLELSQPEDAEPGLDVLLEPARKKTRRHYAVVPAAAVKTVAALSYHAPSELETKNLPAYLVIAPAVFHETLKPFVAHRQGLLVDLEEVYNLFSYGLPEPQALRRFLLLAAERGAQMALLVGDGHFDYRDFQSSGVPQYVPVALVPNRFGETVSDAYYATPEGALVPKLALGRWPVTTVEALQAVIDKTLAYEERTSHGAVFLADDEPVFRATLDQLSQLLPHPEEVVRINYGEYDALGAKAKLLETINSGTGLLAYDGHGGVQLWSSAQLLTAGDVETLTNDGQYPVLLALGCLSGYFGYPIDMDSLAETLLRAEAKGVVAAFSPSGLTSSVEQQALATALLQALVADHKSLGAALLHAYQAVEAQVPASKARGLIHTFNLLGDPALALQLQ